MRPDRKLLIITYHYPPDSSVGSLRPAKVAKYLAAQGWTPFVLSVDERHCQATDSRRLEDVAGIPVIRTKCWPTVLQLALRARDALQRLWGTRLRSGRRDETRASGGHPATLRPRASRPRLLDAVRRGADSIFEFPDKQIGWLIPAVWAAYRLLRRERIGLVLTSSPPRSTALVGLVLSYLRPITLVTDFRDPWFHGLVQNGDGRTALSDRLGPVLERRILARSAKVITTTEHHRSLLALVHQSTREDALYVMPNGFDADDFGLPDGRNDIGQRSSTFTVSYLGTFYHGRDPSNFLQAVSELLRDGELPRDGVQINFIGEVRHVEQRPLEEIIREHGLTGQVRVLDSVSHAEALRWMRRSDVLLLYATNQYCSVPAKTFEYLGARRPMLCLDSAGATADLVRAMGAGIAVEGSTVEEIKAALRQLFRERTSGTFVVDPLQAARYERKALVGQLARMLEQLVDGNECERSSS